MRVLACVSGIFLLFAILLDAFETIVLPRRASRGWRITRLFYLLTWGPWSNLAVAMHDRRRRESLLSFYGPLSLLLLLVVWATGLLVGFALIYYSAGSPFYSQMPAAATFRTDLYVSGTTIFTLGLGDVIPTSSAARFLAIVESGTGLGFLAIIIGYLPVLYAAFSKREVDIALLDARAGSPPTPFELLHRHNYPGGNRDLEVLLEEWERWSAELLESHISYPVLCLFRSQHDNQSWLSALVAILDTSALVLVGIEDHCVRQAQLTFAISRHCLVDLAQIFGLKPGVPSGAERLAPGGYCSLARKLQDVGVTINTTQQAEDHLRQLRALYEGHALVMADFLQMPLSPWMTDKEHRDQWMAVARIQGADQNQQAVRSPAEALDEDHL